MEPTAECMAAVGTMFDDNIVDVDYQPSFVDDVIDV